MPIADQNLSSTIPAAPSGKQNAKWQVDSSTPRNNSANVPWTGGAAVKTGSYQIEASDCGFLLAFEGSADGTFELPLTPPFAQWCCFISNNSSPSGSPPATPVLTITPLSGSPPSGANLDGGSASITLQPGQGVYIATDGTNYFSERGMGSGGGSVSPEPANEVYAGPASGSAADPTFRALVAADLPVMVGDTGSGGTRGAVPAPPAGSAAAKFLKADGTFSVPPGGGGAGSAAMWNLSPPALANFSWLNQASAVSQGGTNFLAIVGPTSAAAINSLVQNVPGSTPWTVYALMMGDQSSSGDYVGMCISDGTKVVTLLVRLEGSPLITVDKWNSSTSFNGNVASASSQPLGGQFWLAIENDGAGTYHFQFSQSGVYFRDFTTLSVGSFLTATEVGFTCYAASDKTAAVCLSFSSSLTAQ